MPEPTKVSHLPDSAPTEPSAHPAGLLQVGRPYLVPWGRTEVSVTFILALSLLAFFGYLTVKHSYFWGLGVIVTLGLAAFFILFFRNPSRVVPTDAGILVSPADGTVWDIEEVDEVDFVGARCLRIGIFLSIFDVHVNRAPTDGRVAHLQHRDGHYHDARSVDAASKNESNAIGIVCSERRDAREVKLLIKQISGAIARRIVCPLEVGEAIRRGGLLGMIKYGSRTELYVPLASGVEARVKVGDKVQGGATVLAAWPRVDAPEATADGN